MIEKVKIEFTESRTNLYNVPLRQWRKWGPRARQVFNEVFSSMAKNQRLFLHPHQDKLSKRMWRITCWNAAWIAAGAANN